MVKLIRVKGQRITLAIGDGANDCNMIQEANVGIGIYGNIFSIKNKILINNFNYYLILIK